MKKLLILCLSLLIPLGSLAQLTPDLAAKLDKKEVALQATEMIHPNDYLMPGVGDWFKGQEFSYSFPVKGVGRALLIRATDGTQTLRWRTPQIPANIDGKEYVNFVIPVAIGTNSLRFTMDFKIDGTSAFTIDNRDTETWEMTDSEGRILTFESIQIDGNRDRRGFFYLRIPKAKLPKDGKPIEMSITADRRGSQAWFMIFTDQIKNKQSVSLSPAIIGNQQQLMVEIMHFGAPTPTEVRVDGKTIGNSTIVMGNNTFTVGVDKVTKPRKAKVEIVSAGKTVSKEITLTPSREWEVYFVQHTHTDIGYTRPQNEILGEHIRYIDYALDYCDQTDDLPEAAQFRWTCETTWAVEQFLKTRPQEQIDRLIQRIKEGRIEVAGMLFNFSELPDENTLKASLQPLKTCHDKGVKVELAMQNDVNGMAWALADYLPSVGVKYLSMGTHGHRALICFDYPTVFRWQSPSGSEMIACRAEHYNTGNFFGIEKDNFEDFEIKLLNYLTELQGKGYPYDIASIDYSGYFTDNSPPSLQGCENVRKWNEKYTFPKIRLSVSSEFLKKIEKDHYDELPVLKQAWPDWWTDGFGAAARETAVGRYSKSNMMSVEGLLSMAAIEGTKIPEESFQQIDVINEAILFYDEHTAGFSESVRQPWAKASVDQRALKESYVWDAYNKSRILNETALGLLQSSIEKGETPTIMVYNTLNFARTGIAECYIDHEILPINKQYKIIDIATGEELAAQPMDSRADGTYWQIRVEDIPAMGARQLAIITSQEKIEKKSPTITLTPEIENEFYKLSFDANKGTISTLYDKELGESLTESVKGYDLGEFICERLAERGSMEAYTMGEYERMGLDTVWFINQSKGAIYDTYRFAGRTTSGVDTPAANFMVEYKLHHHDKLLEMSYSLTKKSITDPEGIYIAMPFTLDDSKIFCEVPGGVIEAGVDQIKGSSNDWNTHQNFAAVRNSNSQIVVGSAEIPLMQFGNINTGRYEAGAKPESSNIFSWVMNNYWTTNFNAEQRGELQWNYYITSMPSNSDAQATRFGWGMRTELPTRIIAPNHDAKPVKNPIKKGLEFEAENLLLICASPVENENAVMLQVREIEGKEATMAINGYKLQECNVLGETIKNGSLEIKPLATKFFKLYY